MAFVKAVNLQKCNIVMLPYPHLRSNVIILLIICYGYPFTTPSPVALRHYSKEASTMPGMNIHLLIMNSELLLSTNSVATVIANTDDRWQKEHHENTERLNMSVYYDNETCL